MAFTLAQSLLHWNHSWYKKRIIRSTIWVELSFRLLQKPIRSQGISESTSPNITMHKLQTQVPITCIMSPPQIWGRHNVLAELSVCLSDCLSVCMSVGHKNRVRSVTFDHWRIFLHLGMNVNFNKIMCRTQVLDLCVKS